MQIVWRNSHNKKLFEKERTKRLFNAVIPARFPLAIASARREQDVVDTVNLAISKNCHISVRAGGHSYAAWSVRNDAILLDLGDFRECELDENYVICVSPSVTGRELHDFLSERGRFFPVGHCPDVGVGGYLLGGGMGWNQPNLGWACEHIVAVDVVTAAGERKRADAQQNSDLFWAARGGGPAFPGIVTKFYLRTLPAPGIMRSSGYIYGVGHYLTAFTWALEIAAAFENNIEIVAIGSYQDGIDTPCMTIALLAFGDDEYQLEILLQGVEDSHPDGALSHWFCQKTNLAEQFDFKAKAYPAGHRWYVDNAFIRNDSDVAAVLRPAFTTLPTRNSLALWSSMIPLSRKALPDMAVSMQSDHYFAIYAVWRDESEDSRSRVWANEVMESVGAQSVGSYLGELDFRSRNTKYWAEEQRTRLMEVRRKWDPASRICGCLGLEGLGLS